MHDAESLGDGVYVVRLPLPFPAPRLVNAYVFEASDGLTLLDCGVDSADGHQVLERALAEIGGPLTTLVGSHLHVDHVGMAGRLIEESGARWIMHDSTDAEVPLYNDWEERRRRLAATAARHGAPPDFGRRMETAWERPAWYGPAISPTHPVADGDRIPLGAGRHLEVLYTPGHQANHICLVDSRTGVLYSGDHVLPRISPFVPYAGFESDTLGDYLHSIGRVEGRRFGSTRPAHGAEIERGSARAAQIGVHHERRLDSMLAELTPGPRTAWEVMEAVFRPNLGFAEQRLALQETLSHLTHLTRRSAVVRIDGEDLVRFRRAR